MKEELQAFKDIAYLLHMHRNITMDNNEVVKLLDRLHHWTASHSDGNGGKTEIQIQQNINRAFWLHLADDSTKGEKP